MEINFEYSDGTKDSFEADSMQKEGVGFMFRLGINRICWITAKSHTMTIKEHVEQDK
jgi:hypothetical protein